MNAICVPGMPLVELERELLLWGGRVAAGEAELIRLIGEFDARNGWAAAGSLSCAHWLAWRLGLSPGASRERVRVAQALRVLPATAKVFGAGRLSYAQVRALTRVASAEDELTWLALAEHTTAAQLEKAVRGVRRARKPVEDAADPEQAAWRDRPRVEWDEDGSLLLTLRISPVHAPAVLASLEQAQVEEQAERDDRLAQLAVELAGVPAETPDGDVPAEELVRYEYVEPPYPQFPQRVGLFDAPAPGRTAAIEAYWQEVQRRRARADAWQQHQERVQAEAVRRGEVCTKATLTDAFVRLVTRPGQTSAPKVVLQVDPLSGWARTAADELLPPSTLAQLLKTLPGRQPLPRVRPLAPADLTRHDQGRRSRLVSPAQRRLLGLLDGECCRMPGCTRTRKLHAHHVVFWRDGGRTDLANLVLICTRHHTLIHEHGYQLVLHPDRTLTVHTADGTALLHHPALPWQPKEDLDPERQVTPDSLPTQWNGDRMDLDHVVWVLTQHAA